MGTVDLHQVGTGLQLGIKGLSNALNTPKIVRYFFKSSAVLILLSIMFYLIFNNLVLLSFKVLKIANLIAGYLFNSSSVVLDKKIDQIMQNTNSALSSLPLTSLYFIRYLYPYPLNNIFLNSLKNIDQQLYMELSNREYKTNWKQELYSFFRRLIKRFQLLGLLVLLSFFPFYKGTAYSLFTVFVCRKQFGLLISCFVGIVCLYNISFGMHLLKTYFGCQHLTRELLEPYFGRMYANETSAYKKRKSYFIKNSWMLFGFSVFYYVLINVRYIGPVFFVFAQSAISVALTETLKRGDPEKLYSNAGK